jgi:hypothetical protein
MVFSPIETPASLSVHAACGRSQYAVAQVPHFTTPFASYVGTNISISALELQSQYMVEAIDIFKSSRSKRLNRIMGSESDYLACCHDSVLMG